MNLELSNKQFRRLLDLVYIGNWILNSTRGDQRFTDYDEVESLVFGRAALEGMPSLAALAGSVGYDSTAFHPYKSSGWNRPIVYEDMRFDHQLYEEDVTDPYLVRRYVSDQSDYEMLYSITDREEGDPAFIFNVTMQNHSSYAQGWNNLEKTVTLSTDCLLYTSRCV